MDEAENHWEGVAVMHMGSLAALGTCAELKASIGGQNRSFDEVFAHFAGTTLDSDGNYRNVSSERATERRLG
jgi:ABC-2 type transport system ATP-binding protein